MNDIDIFEDLDNSNNVENNKQAIEENSNIEYIEVFRSKKTLRRYELFNVDFYSYGSLSIGKRKWKYLNNNSNNSNNSDSDNENNNDDNNRFESWCNQNMCGDDCFSGSEDNDRRTCCHKCNERVHGNESEEFKKCVGCCEQHEFGTEEFEKCMKEDSKCGTIPGFCAHISKNNCEMKECMKWFNDDPNRVEDYFFTCESWKPRSKSRMYSSYAYFNEDVILDGARNKHKCDPCAQIFACNLNDVLNDKRYTKCDDCRNKYGYMTNMFKKCMEKEINEIKNGYSSKQDIFNDGSCVELIDLNEIYDNCKFCKCARFDGNRVINTGIDMLPFIKNGGAFSLWVRANPNENKEHVEFFGQRDKDDKISSFSLYWYNKKDFLDFDNAGDKYYKFIRYNGFNSIITNWTHIVVVFDGSGGFSGYINGSFVGSASLSTRDTNSGLNLLIGSSTINDSFVGFIDQVRIFNRPLTSDEINILYTEAN